MLAQLAKNEHFFELGLGISYYFALYELSNVQVVAKCSPYKHFLVHSLPCLLVVEDDFLEGILLLGVSEVCHSVDIGVPALIEEQLFNDF
eukprot:CAMPEP_0202975318 /NCGR_PEP_ID=MMETSP1396-20130829/68091_1 /ASSEMBLY_ACC=CAM_ASM_000872 /TAXON_ID= /ORGANISM="Pseudokeronopsis sp., Strain Brazil" /LENGTH=89 /DNA_ID=CAMNT_0049710709 /DNA_START=255 /DNA_END=521 /DNA_ORIENTATION=+